jgi:hypothetical protein
MISADARAAAASSFERRTTPAATRRVGFALKALFADGVGKDVVGWLSGDRRLPIAFGYRPPFDGSGNMQPQIRWVPAL